MYKKLTNATIKEIRSIIGEKNVVCEKKILDIGVPEFPYHIIQIKNICKLL